VRAAWLTGLDASPRLAILRNELLASGRLEVRGSSGPARALLPLLLTRDPLLVVVSRERSGIFDSSAAAGSSVSGWLRVAPFGVPVVPEVRMTTRPGSAGGTTSAGSPASISSSRVGSETVSSPSFQATKRLRRTAASPIRLRNSSSNTIARGPSRCTTSSI